MKTIYSIGHSNKKSEDLLKLLREHKITDLVDVRTYPSSKYNPQFNRFVLDKFLTEHSNIKYHWKGRNLGGLGGNTEFNETIGKMLNLSSDERRFCVMCSESEPEKCHRTSTILPEVERQGGQMFHILWFKPEKEIHNKEEKTASLF